MALFHDRGESDRVRPYRADLIGCLVGGTARQHEERTGRSLGKEARDAGAFTSFWRGKEGVPMKVRWLVRRK